MPDNAYKKALDKVPVSANFEERTMRKLEDQLKTAPEPNVKRVRRRPLRAAGFAAAGLAAVLLVVLIAPKVLPLRFTTYRAPEADITLAKRTGTATHAAQPAGAETEADSYALNDTAALTGEAPLPRAPVMAAAVAPAEWNTDEYAFIRESGFLSTLTSPLSTFAADVDTASYANIRRMLLQGETPPADAVRIEEMLNYFHYDYPKPGDGEPFSVTTEIAPCPWNADAKLLLVGLQAKEIDESSRPASNLVFLIDVSGSMDSPEKLGLVQKAFLLLTEQMREGDKISIVTYAGTDSVVLEGATASDKARIMTAIENLTAGGTTAGSEGIQTAYRIAREQFLAGGNNRVILATDGDMNVGITSEGELTRLIEREKQEGVFLSVMGFGYGNLKDNKLESLADHGNGNYAYIDSILEARKVLVEETGANFFTVCKDVKFQLEFNPERVAKYRQIGYENRRMDNEDFADDQKDGGEIGAGHRVTVLYEIIEAKGDGQDGAGLKYQKNATTGSSEYLTVSVRAKEPDGDTSKLYAYPVGDESAHDRMSDNMNFASAVAQAGMLLRGSEYSGTASYASVAKQLDSIAGVRDDPYKDEFAYLIRRLARGEIQ